MNARERVAWFELGITVAAACLVAVLIPWLGDGAMGAFGLLGFLGLSVLFLRKRGDDIVLDERDREIDASARYYGIAAAWMATFMTLAALVIWSSQTNNEVVSARWLSWLVWGQLLLCLFVRGLVGVLAYRGRTGAA